jgi:outer membrane receptor protein involved in Fe transport
VHTIKSIFLFWVFCHVLNFVHGQGKIVPPPAKDTLPLKIDSLKAAVVTAVMRPRMKGDTLEYNTENILMRPNSVVEELLRRLPGLQIDANGNITYNGEKIGRLLVDGEDIFGSDPTMVTRNFDASKIARVQILDRKSEQTLFTGIDDGIRTKTLNLVLKESAKDGYFGKVEAGGNTEGYYNANGAAAAFRDKEQFTVIGLSTNLGTLSFSNAGAGVSFLYGIADPLGASAGTGIPRFNAAALHYANTWDGSGDHLVGNYQFSHYYTEPFTTSQSYQTQPDSIYGQLQQSRSINQYDQHWLFIMYDWAPNAFSAFRFAIRGNNTQEQNRYSADGSSTFNDTLVNSSIRTIQDRMSRQNTGGSLDWKTQIGKRADRVFSITTGFTNIDAITNGYLYSLNQFYQPNGTIQSIDTIDQRKQIASHSLNLGGSLNITEPLWKGGVLGLSYALGLAGDRPLQATFNRGDGKYDQLVDSLSSQLKTQAINQHMTVNLQGKTGHLSYTIGNDLLGFSYRQRDLVADSTLRLHYTNWAPRVVLNYTPNPATNFSFNYNASAQQPTIAQLAPIRNNDDPLLITLGNPDLKPGFNQTFRLNFRRFKTWNIGLGLNMTLMSNSISTKTITDSLGRQISQPVNVDGGRSSGLNFNLGRKLLGIDVSMHTSGTYSRTVNYVNADLNRNDVYTGGGGLSLNKYVVDRYSFQINTSFIYFDQVSSINASSPVHYWTESHSGAVTLYIIRNFEINTNATYTWQEKTSAFSSNTSVLLWNSYLSRNFIHDKLAIKLQFNNILNQNAGISRTNLGNINSQSSTNVLGRCWIVSAIYHFDKKFKKK